MRRTGSRGAALAVALTLAACTGDRSDVPLPDAGPSCPTGLFPETVPAECVETDGALPVQPTSGATSSAQIEPVTLPRVANELARGGNDTVPARTEQSFSVTVPQGARLRSDVACDGNGSLTLTTSPVSGAEQESVCSGGTQPVTFTVEDAQPLAAPRTYTVKVVATPPSRWYVVLSWTNEPV